MGNQTAIFGREWKIKEKKIDFYINLLSSLLKTTVKRMQKSSKLPHHSQNCIKTKNNKNPFCDRAQPRDIPHPQQSDAPQTSAALPFLTLRPLPHTPAGTSSFLPHVPLFLIE